MTDVDPNEGFVRLIVVSFRDAPHPSVDIAVEEIMRTFEPTRELLARYDAIVGAGLEWRARPAVTTSDVEQAEIDTMRKLAHRHGKHIVDESIVRQLRLIYVKSNERD